MLLVACGGEHPTGLAAPAPSADRLKDVVFSNLPSPFYHFEYDDAGRISAISYASALRSYDVTYVGERLTGVSTRAVTNPDRLVYEYDDAGRLAAVKYTNDSGVFTAVFLTYDGPYVTKLERERLFNGVFVVDKTLTMYYDGAGNLRDLVTNRPAIDGVQAEVTTFDQFLDFDTGRNVDAFSLIHDDFFDQLILLPGVHLQKTNPRHVSHFGGGMDFVAEYTYRYDGQNRPIAKTGNLTITSGDQAGKAVVISAQYSYY